MQKYEPECVWKFRVLRRYYPRIQPSARLWYPAQPLEGPGSKQGNVQSLPGLAKGPAGLFSLTVSRTGKIWQLTLREYPAGAGSGGTKERVWLVEHSEGQKESLTDPLLPGSGLPMKGCEWDGPLVAKEVLEATDPALDARRC